MAVHNPLHGIDRGFLGPMVRAALGTPEAEVESWQALPVPGWSGGAVTAGLLRIHGLARVDAAQVPWSLILKVLHSPGAILRARGIESRPGTWEDPDDATYWQREPLAYASGLLKDLPGGLHAPRCYAIESSRAEETRLWLEDVADALPGPWPLARYVQVARELGRFNGAFLGARSLPVQPWLVHGWLRSWVAHRAPHLDLIADARAWEHPLLAGCFEDSARERVLALWEARERYFAALESLPASLAHLDAHPANLLTREGVDGGHETVAVDWSNLSFAPLGAEAQALVVGSVSTLRAPSKDIEVLAASVLEGYQGGLADAGARSDPEALRFAFAASAALHWTFGLTGLLLRDVNAQLRRGTATTMPGVSEQVAGRVRLVRYLLDRGEEARSLLE